MAFFAPKQTAPSVSSEAPQNGKKTSVEKASEETLRERRYLWTARGFAMIFFVSLITNILMLMSLSALTPLVRVQPYELTFSDKKSQTVEIVPMQLGKNAINSISESMLRRYVTARHTITSDRDEMASRWGVGGLVQLLSSDNIFAEFEHTAKRELDEAVAANETRVVDIQSVLPYYRDGWWLVNWNVRRKSPELKEEEVLPYVSTVRVGFLPTRGTWENRLNNPVGFKVMEYGYQTKESFDRREQQRLE